MSRLDVALKRARVPHAIRCVYGLLLRSAWPAIVFHLAVVGAGAVAPAVASAATGVVVGRLVHGAPSGAMLAPALVLGAAVVVSMVASAAEGLGQFLVGERFTAAVERSVMRGVSAIPGLAPFEDPDLADRLEVTRWSAGGELSSGGGAARLWMDVAVSWQYALGAVAAGVVVSRWGWWVPVLCAATAVPVGVVTWVHAGKQWRTEAETTTEYRRSHWFLDLGFDPGAAKETRLFGLASFVAGRHHAHWLNLSKALVEGIRRQTRQESLLIFVRGGAIVGSVLYAIAHAAAIGPGRLTAGLLAMPLLLGNSLSFARVPGGQRLELGRVPDVAALLELDVPRVPSGGAPRPRGSVEVWFEDVHFAYPGTSAPVLRGLDLVVPPGSSLALVGTNGCGKSTLVKLLCRFYDPDVGRILVDGTDLRDYDLDELRSAIAVLFQEPVRYPLTPAENIGVGCLGRIDIVAEAARLAGADSLPVSADAVLARDLGGVDVSGGEWQRIALARTFASKLGRDCSILVADEPTAHMDVRVEHDLYTRFAEVTRGQTTILTSHRFSTVRMAERVAVIEDGRVTELGSHDELVAAHGRYAELYELQARRFRETGVLE